MDGDGNDPKGVVVHLPARPAATLPAIPEGVLLELAHGFIIALQDHGYRTESDSIEQLPPLLRPLVERVVRDAGSVSTDQEMLAEPSIVAIRTVQAYAATLAAAPSSANKAALAEIAAGFADALDHIRALQEGLGEDGDT